MKKQGVGRRFAARESAMTDVPEIKDSSDSGAATKEDPILEIGSVVTHSAKGVIHCLTIIGKMIIIDSERNMTFRCLYIYFIKNIDPQVDKEPKKEYNNYW